MISRDLWGLFRVFLARLERISAGLLMGRDIMHRMQPHKATTKIRHIRRTTATVVLFAYVAGCTHMPSGEKAFDSFESCISANLGLAAVGGIAIGALGSALTKQFTNDRRTANAVGVAAGLAAAVMIGMTAWRKCAAVYSKSEAVARPGDAHAAQPALPRRQPGLSLDRLDVKVEGNENDAPVPEFDFTYFADDPAAKDIKAKFRHKVEIVRFKAGDDDKLVLADAKGDALRDSAGKPIPVESAMRMSRDRLQWVTIAEEGKNDYVEDVVIQQAQHASYRHRLQIPPRAQLPIPLPVPMRYTLTVEAGQYKSTRTVDFGLLGTGERPKRFSAPGSAVTTGEAAPQQVAIQTRSLKEKVAEEFVATHKIKRNAVLFSDTGPKRKSVASLKKDDVVRIEEKTEVKESNKPVVAWVKVKPKAGTGGWVQSSEVLEIK